MDYLSIKKSMIHIIGQGCNFFYKLRKEMKGMKYNIHYIFTFDICSFMEVITSKGVIFKVLTRKYEFKGAEVNHCDIS